MALAGSGGSVSIGTSKNKVAEIAEWTLNLSAEDIDVTSFDSQGWRDRLVGIREWSGSFSGNLDPSDTSGQSSLFTSFANGAPISLTLQVDDDNQFTGSAYITGLSVETPVTDKVSFSCDFVGTGELTVTLTTTTTTTTDS
jgi:predicted secreted protein